MKTHDGVFRFLKRLKEATHSKEVRLKEPATFKRRQTYNSQPPSKEARPKELARLKKPFSKETKLKEPESKEGRLIISQPPSKKPE